MLKLIPLLKALNIKDGALPFKVSYTLLYKSLLILLINLSFCQGIISQTLIDIDKEKEKINKVKAISNPTERALKWLLYIYLNNNKSPEILNLQLNTSKTLWNDQYTNKEAIALLTKVEVDKVQGNYQNITANSLKAIQIIESNSPSTIIERKILVLTYCLFSRISKHTKEINGLNYAYKALELADVINYPTGKVFAHNQIGLIARYSEKKYALASEHFHKAKKILPQLPPYVNKIISGFILGNIALTWSDLGDIKKSIHYKLEILADEKNKDNIELQIVTNSNLGNNYYELKDYQSANKHLQTALSLMRSNKIIQNLGIPLLRVGLIQLKQGDKAGALATANEIDDWLINYKFLSSYKVEFYQFKSNIAKETNNYEQAIYWLEQASLEEKSENELAQSSNLVKLEEKEKFRLINQELLLLEKEKEFNQATIKLQKILLISIFFIAILSIWFGVTYYEKNKEITDAYDYILSKKEIKEKSPQTGYTTDAEPAQQPYQIRTIDEALKQKIIHSLQVDKSFLSPNLTLKTFADLVDSNTSYVSKTINDGFGKNFNALINEYRIEEVLRLFQEKQHQMFTIESIYQKAGFKSKSSFQKSFKAKTGVTASHYLNHIS